VFILGREDNFESQKMKRRWLNPRNDGLTQEMTKVALFEFEIKKFSVALQNFKDYFV
jgi:hypothetical protein